MLDMIRKIWKTGTVTEDDLFKSISDKYKGIIEIDEKNVIVVVNVL